MHRSLLNKIDKANPDFNPKLVEGLTKSQLDQAPSIIDKLWRDCISPSLPKELKYEKSDIATPEEVIKVLTSVKNKDSKIEMLRTDFILAKYYLSWEENGVREMFPPIYIPLPYCNRYSLTTIRGVINHISHVVSDKVFSRVDKGLFMAFMKDRLTFERLPFAYNLSGMPVKTLITYSNIHAYSKKQKTKSGAKPTLVLYLLSYYGLSECLSKFLDMTDEDFIIGTESEITEDKYSPDKYYIAKSYKHRLKGYDDVVPAGMFDIAFAVNKEKFEANKLVSDFIAGMFYSIEYFPSKTEAKWMKSKQAWLTILAGLIYRDDITNGRKLVATSTHIESLTHYVDVMTKEKLMSIGIESDDIFELFVYILHNIDELFIDINPASMNNKRIATTEYVLMDVVKKINNFAYSVFKRTNAQLDKRTVRQRLSKHIANASAVEVEKHGEVNAASFVGDNSMFKFNTQMISQVDATVSGKSKKPISDPSKAFDATIMAYCSHLNQTKPHPTGDGKINPNVIIDEYNGLNYDSRLKEVIQNVNETIK